MPGLDGTGPQGLGPMTGGGRGLCAADVAAPQAVRAPGYGRGQGFGRGMGRGRGMGSGRGMGRGYRTQYHATGLTGWQRAQMDAAADVSEDASGAPQDDRLEQIERQLDEVLTRLTRLEGTE